MANWFGIVYISLMCLSTMCLVSGQGNAVFVQNALLKDTLCPDYTLNGHRGSVVDCGRTCASNVTCRAFCYDITSGDCYIIYTAVVDLSLCVFKPGYFYEVAPTASAPTAAAPTAATPTAAAPQAAQAPMTSQMPCSTDSDCASAANMICMDSMCQCAAPTKFNSASSSCVASCGSFGTSYTRIVDTVFNGNQIDTVIAVTSVMECMVHCSARPRCSGVQFWSETSCKMKEESSSFSGFSGIEWHMRHCAS